MAVIKNQLLSEKLQARLYPVVLEMFSNHDFHQVNIRAISRVSGVSSGTIYKYFDSKEDLIFSILNQEINQIAVIIKLHISGMRDIKEILRKVFWSTMDFYDQNPGVAITAFITVPMRNWMKEGRMTLVDEAEVLLKPITIARSTGQLSPEISDKQLLDLYYMHCYRHIHQWYFHGMQKKLAETIDDFFDVFWRTVKP